MMEQFINLVAKVNLHSNFLYCSSCGKEEGKLFSFFQDNECPCGGILAENNDIIIKKMEKDFNALDSHIQNNICKLLEIKNKPFIGPQDIQLYENLLSETLLHLNGTTILNAIKWL